MDLKVPGLAVCALAAVAIVARILWLFANRVPVLARSENVDALGDSLSGDPLNPAKHPHGIQRMSPFHTADMRVAYEVGGQQYEHDRETHTIDGLDITGPNDMPILWADPENPVAVERRGPGFWALMLVLVGAVAALIAQFS